jgi:Domain of unknown function (DUF4328)
MNKIEICKTCSIRVFDKNQGIICGLTNAKPTFEESCPDFKKDESIKEIKKSALKPNDQRGNLAVLLIWIVLGLEILSLISGYFQFDLLNEVKNGANVSTGKATANDLREGILGIIYGIAYLISGITFIQWFRRAYFNLHQKVDGLSHTEGWAAGSWFVPIVNLFRPFQIMKEMFIETKAYLIKNNISFNEEINTKNLGIWWTLWIINNFLGQIIFHYSKNSETVDQLLNFTIINLVSNVFGILLAVITIKVIKDYINLEEKFI